MIPTTHRFLKHDDGSLQVHAEIYHGPVNALSHVLLLLHNEHVVIEELLELLVDKVNGDLLEAIVLKDLKASDIQDSNKVDLLHSGVTEGGVTLDDEPLEDAVIHGPGDATNSAHGLVNVLTLGDPLCADLDPGLAEGLHHSLGINSAASSNLSSNIHRIRLTLFLSALLLKLHLSHLRK